jgi:hypothetical protein
MAVEIPAPPLATVLEAARAPFVAIKARAARPIAFTARPIVIVAAAEGTLLSVIARARPVAFVPALIASLAAKTALGELLLGAMSGGAALAEAALA